MTGNNKVWRAPVAGLASVAMLATLGVSAMTANADDYTLTWVFANGDTYSQPVVNGEIRAGDLIAENGAHVAPAGQTATGWYTAAGVGNGERVQPGTKVSGDVTLYQHASADVQTITFDNVGTGSSDVVKGVEEYTGDDPTTTVVAVGDSVAAWQIPSEDIIDHKVVVGWNSTAGAVSAADGLTAEEIASITPVVDGQHQSQITLTPETAEAWTVTFNGTDFANKNWILAAGDKAQFDVKKGAAFSEYGDVPRMTSNETGPNRQVDSWKENKDDKTAFDPDAAVTKDLILHPASAKNYWTVQFDYANGTGNLDSVTVVDGQTVAAPSDPTKLSDSMRYEFAGWYTGTPEAKYDFSTPVKSNLTLKAKWNVVAVKVSFVPNYGSELPTEVWIKDGDKLAGPELTREGYQFDGWADVQNGADYSVYNDAQGYPIHIAKDTGALSYTTSNGADGTFVHPIGTKFYAHWTENGEAIATYEGYVDVNKDADKQKLYTADSYKAYVDAFKGDYLTAKQKASSDGLTNDEYASLITQLKDMQSKLVEVGNKNLYRVYNPNNGDHYFTTLKTEADRLVKLGWKAEGAPYKVCMKRTHNFGTAVYSVYNPNTGEHLLAFKAEADALANKGWVKENVKFYTVQNGSQDVVRVYNPNTSGPAHLYTKMSEASILAGKGWIIDNNAKPVFTLD